MASSGSCALPLEMEEKVEAKIEEEMGEEEAEEFKKKLEDIVDGGGGDERAYCNQALQGILGVLDWAEASGGVRKVLPLCQEPIRQAAA